MAKFLRFAAGLLLIAAILTAVYAVRVYRRGAERARLDYTQLIKQHDIVDSARNALSALQDAELREQDYVLTGETTYSEAYAGSIRNWQDEVGTLVLVAKKDPAALVAQDLARTGDRTAQELAAIMALYEEGSRDKALDRIHKGSAIVYLDQTRESEAKILDMTRFFYQSTSIGRLGPEGRLLECAGALFCATFAAAGLLIFAARPVVQPALRAKSSVATA